jgi:epoxide hydrolase-like predicted phosphatase
MSIQAVIWDLGGVLVRTEDYMSREELAKRLGFSRKELEFLVFAGDSGERAQRGEIDTDEHFENLRLKLDLSDAGMKDFLDDFFRGDELDMTLVDYIRSLRGRYKTGLLSNAFSNLRHWVTEVWEFSDAFDEMVISAEVGLVKPDAHIYRLALKHLDVSSDEAVFVDDRIENIEGAQGVGMHAIQFYDAEKTIVEVEKLLKN